MKKSGKFKARKLALQPKKSKKSIRATQLVSPFGVGAVVDIGGESFTCMDISEWPAGNCVPLADNNLEDILGKEIRKPPSEDQGAGVPFRRFPRWLFCPSCRELVHYNQTRDAAADFAPPTCGTSECNGTALVPMRFVAVCENGHIQDVDWYSWAHRNAQPSVTGQCSRQTSRLRFNTTGASGGDFNAMNVECSCGGRNSFEGLTDRDYPFKCEGRQPWQKFEESESCVEKPRVHPRGATNVYYASSLSALDIDARGLGQAIGHEAGLRAWVEKNAMVAMLKQAAIAIRDWRAMPDFYKPAVDEACRQFELPRETVESIIFGYVDGNTKENEATPEDGDQSQHGILLSEWPFLARSSGLQSQHLRTRAIQTIDAWPEDVSRIWTQITLVERLREVRALLGFRRLKPDSESKMVPVDLGRDVSWIPGVEMFGEGIFLQFDEKFLSKWEATVTKVYARRTATLQKKCEDWGRRPANVYAMPRFIAIHTFAHGLIRRLSFDAGYSSSSLRERIYCDTGLSPKAGVLVYTSDGDSEGSLGGLVRQGRPERLLLSLRRAIADLSWCSGDPVCSELENQGVDGLNAAACHACSLLSETSCVFNNSLLDRRLLFGSKQAGIEGLFEDVDVLRES